MLSVHEAQQAIFHRVYIPEPRRVALAEALNCELGEPVVADLDLPPFDKALMDGYAVRASDCQGEGPHILTIGEEILAGRTPTRPLHPGEAAVIMTGAPLPLGADAVVMQERTELREDGRVEFSGRIKPGLARLERGREMRSGQVLFDPGTRLDAVKLGVLAAVGVESVHVFPRPRVMIIPTGDELVTVGTRPGPGQIRESNSTMLAALVRTSGGIPEVRRIAPDHEDGLRQLLVEALDDDPDVILLCGGVSAGKKDLVPAVLELIGIERVFHKVRLKPGKPLFFGTRPVQGGPTGSMMDVDPPTPYARSTFVFGLPGNPASVLVGFLLFVSPLLKRLRCEMPSWEPTEAWPLAQPFRHLGDRPTYYPAELLRLEDGTQARPLDWAGSADLYAISKADGFLCFPEGDHDYRPGDSVPFLPLPGIL